MKREKHKLLLYHSILLELMFYSEKLLKQFSVTFLINLFSKTKKHNNLHTN